LVADKGGGMSAIADNLHTTLGPLAAAVLRKAAKDTTTAKNEKCKGMRLRPIPWGKPDKDLGAMLLTHMIEANPPIVIRWSPHHRKLKRYMERDVNAFDARVEDLYNLVAQRFPVPENTP
jgi:hypothetical protein